MDGERENRELTDAIRSTQEKTHIQRTEGLLMGGSVCMFLLQCCQIEVWIQACLHVTFDELMH